jgi:aconitate hydratase
MAYALAGTLSFNPLEDEITVDGKSFKLEAPGPAPEVPEGGFEPDPDGYVAPTENDTQVVVSPTSERLQLLTPFDAWHGDDYTGLPLLLKAKGKCTTDHISMAGPWLKFRGHLDNISNNCYIGANSDFHDTVGGGKSQLAPEAAHKPYPAIARDYKAAGQRWVVVGDENFGEGSSREHAAMEPRFLGCAAIITRSFARIHETNLKKQGVLALNFVNPDDYNLVQEDDRIGILGLKEMAPGKNLTVSLTHADGSNDTFEVRHSCNADQIGWFRSGSALNVLRGA